MSHDEEQEPLIVNPDDLPKDEQPKRRRSVIPPTHQVEEPQLDEELEGMDSEEPDAELDEFEKKRINQINDNVALSKTTNLGETVVVNYESRGRFDVPARVHWIDFTTKDVNDLSLTRQDDMLETMIDIMERMHKQDFDMQDMLLDELYETMIAIKLQFVGPEHTHRWICRCQNGVHDDDRVPSEQIVMLDKLQYVSIEEAERKLEESIREDLKDLNQAELTEFAGRFASLKNTDLSSVSLDTIIKAMNISIKEPIIVEGEGRRYEFKFTRVGDLLKAKRIADINFADKYKTLRKKRYKDGENLAEFKAHQEWALKKLDIEKAKAVVLYAKALSLVKMNGRELSNAEKIKEFEVIPRQIMSDYIKFMNLIIFGVNHEADFTCNLCGHTERGFLRQRITPLEFLPFDIPTSRRVAKAPRTVIHFTA